MVGSMPPDGGNGRPINGEAAGNVGPACAHSAHRRVIGISIARDAGHYDEQCFVTYDPGRYTD
jgi:hypothetical protein